MHKDSEPVGELLSPRQLQEWLGLGRTTVYAALKTEIPSYKVGKRRLIRRTDVEEWLESHKHIPGGLQ